MGDKGLNAFEMLWESALVASVNSNIAGVAAELSAANQRDAAILDVKQTLHSVESRLCELLNQCRHCVPTTAGPSLINITWDLDAIEPYYLSDMADKDRLQAVNQLADQACEALEQTTPKFYQLASWEAAGLERAIRSWFLYWAARNVETVTPLLRVLPPDHQDVRDLIRETYNKAMSGVDEVGNEDPSRMNLCVHKATLGVSCTFGGSPNAGDHPV